MKWYLCEILVNGELHEFSYYADNWREAKWKAKQDVPEAERIVMIKEYN